MSGHNFIILTSEKNTRTISQCTRRRISGFSGQKNPKKSKKIQKNPKKSKKIQKNPKKSKKIQKNPKKSKKSIFHIRVITRFFLSYNITNPFKYVGNVIL
jgi:hypothetical protein